MYRRHGVATKPGQLQFMAFDDGQDTGNNPSHHAVQTSPSGQVTIVMMIDTDKARKELEDVGFTPVQVEAQLNVVRMLDQAYHENLATKDDPKKLITSLNADMEKLEERLRIFINKRLLITGFSIVTAVLAGFWGILELYLG